MAAPPEPANLNRTSYDEVPYPAGAYQQSHPDRLEALAKLFGMSPPAIHRCRVLELGCADGSNLIPMAVALPESTFIGIDLASRQIKPGQEIIAALGLTNVELRQLDIGDLDESFGTFDYVIAHGIYSWVPKEVQEKILSICNTRLRENGVAYVSYNTYPGWRMRGMLRDMMLYHSRKFDDPQMQIEQARALINWLAETVESENNHYGMLLKRELEQMQRWQDTYLRHDSLEEINEPVYFHQFTEQAERHGLQYLGEAEFSSMLASNYAAPIDETLNRLGRDIIEMEQYMDFLRNRMFRQTLLCHRGLKLSRALGPWSLFNFHVAALLQPAKAGPNLLSSEVEEFRHPNGMMVSTGQPITKAAFAVLAARWSQGILFPELVAGARSLLQSAGVTAQEVPDEEAARQALGASLLTCFTKGACELHAHPGAFVLSPGERPQACPLARLQAARGNPATNRRHERVMLDRFEQQLLARLDGAHNRTSLVEILTGLATDGTLSVTVEDKPVRDRETIRRIMTTQLDAKLVQLGRRALLVG